MFKKVLQVATVFGVLLAGYAGYVQVFALVADHLSRELERHVPHFAHIDSKTERRSMDLAVKAFGPGHWSTGKILRYYNAEQGYWIYAKDYERLNDGKQLKFSPFAIIWQSRDGRAMKTATSESATIDLDKPLGLMDKPGGGSMRVIHARIERDVRLRDDKGTPGDPSDDLKIGPLTYVEYDEATLKITGDENDTVLIEDRDLRVTGQHLEIQLRPKEVPTDPATGAPLAGAGGGSSATGFNGAKTLILHRNPHIVIGDVGPSGILPGNSRNGQGDAKLPGEKTPLDLRADSKMIIDLPKPDPEGMVGPPSPRPTIAQFFRNVAVVRGKPGEPPDKLDCDYLKLTLMPADKPATPAAPATDAAVAVVDPDAPAGSSSSGPLNDLTLRRADATGHNVRVVSSAQGVKARCNELIHKKQMPEAADETYFRGDPTTKLVVEKVETVPEGPEKGKVTSYTTIRTIDATVFDSGGGNDNASVRARGPGELESRPGLDKPVERTAHWSDELILTNDGPPVAGRPVPGAPAPPADRKKITLIGHPGFRDISSDSTLEADRTLVVWLRPKANAKTKTDTKSSPKPGTAETDARSSMEIDRLVGLKNVRLTAPAKNLVARDRLDAEFVAVIDPSQELAPAATPTNVASANGAPASTPAPGDAAPKTAAPKKSDEPQANAIADKVWARVLLHSGGPSKAGNAVAAAPVPSPLGAGGTRSEIDKVFLRGTVAIHQDPAAGKTRGTEVRGEAVDLLNQGNGANRFVIFNVNPNGTPPRTDGPGAAPIRPPVRPAVVPTAMQTPTPGTNPTLTPSPAPPPDPAPADLAPLATVATDEMTIRGQVIGMDQAIDQAWVDGLGSLTLMAERGLLSDKGLPASGAPAAAKPKAAVVPIKLEDKAASKPDVAADAPPRTPLTITWTSGMRFFGRPENGRPDGVARAEFYDDVHAEMEDAVLDCRDVMRTFFDRPVKLNKPRSSASTTVETQTDDPDAPAKKEPDPALAVIECVKNVVVVNLKRDPEKPGRDGRAMVVQKQRITGDYLIYEKSSGRFRVPGEGEVRLWEIEGQTSLIGMPGAKPGAGPAPAGPRDVGLDDTPARREPLIRLTAGPPQAKTGRNPARTGDRAPAQAKAKAAPRPAAPPPKLIVTQIKFRKDMIGRFGSGKESDKSETRWADFFGDVEVVRGPAADFGTVLDADRLPTGAQFMTAQILRVVSEPNAKDPDGPARSLLRAWQNANAIIDGKLISADTIAFDSETDKFFAYGEEGRNVLIAEQQHVGQGVSPVEGRAAMYNQKTGEATLIDPRAFAVIDRRTGTRPKPVPPPDPNTKPKRPPRQKLRNPTGNIERKDFTGR